MKIAVCEDNAQEREAICAYIRDYCEQHGFLASVDSYTSGEALLAAYPEESYSIIFLDIVMEGITGIETARIIRESEKPCTIVFITASDDFALDAYRVDGAAYILKPVSAKGMDHALDKCRRELMDHSRYIDVPLGRRGIINVPLANLHYVEVYNKNTCFHIGEETVVVPRMSLDEIEGKLGGAPFLRCHRSYIINMNYVAALHSGEFQMKSGDKIPIPVRQYTQLQLAYGTHLTKRLKEELSCAE